MTSIMIMIGSVRCTRNAHFAILIQAVIKFVATLTWIVTGGDKHLFVSEPGDHADVVANNGGHMASHDSHVFADGKFVVHLHSVRLLHHFKVKCGHGTEGQGKKKTV